MKQSPKSLDSLLQHFSEQNPSLQTIVQQSRALSQLGDALKKVLPPEMRSQVRAANFKEGTLILQISSAAWQLRLNYLREELIDTLRQSILPGLVSISFKINPDLLTQKQNSDTLNQYQIKVPIRFELKTPRQLSLKSSELLISLSHETSPRLAEALKKMALHGLKGKQTL